MTSFLEGNQVFSLVSLATALIALGMALWVRFRCPGSRASPAFIALMGVVFVGGLVDFLMMNAAEEATARLMARVLFFLLVAVFGGYAYLSSLLPFETPVHPFFRRPRNLVPLIAGAGLPPALAVDEMLRTSYGWGVPVSTAILLLAVEVTAMVLISLHLQVRVMRRAHGREVRRRSLLLIIAVTLPPMYALSYSLLEGVGADMPPVLSGGFLVSNVVFALGVVRHHLFDISPVSERGKGRVDEEVPSLDQGITIVKEKKPSRAYDIFSNELYEGGFGLVVSRDHPDVVRSRNGLESTPVVWLASQPGPDRVDPNNLTIVRSMIMEFIRKSGRAVVMVDGLEYLVLSNGLDRVLKMFYLLRDEIAGEDVSILIPIDPETLMERELALVEREGKVIDAAGRRGEGRDRDLNSSQGIHSPTG